MKRLGWRTIICPACGTEINTKKLKVEKILNELRSKPQRFNELQRNTGVAKPYLIDLLKELQANGEIQRNQIAKQHVIYSLSSEKGEKQTE